MSAPRVSVAAGGGYDLLLSAVSVADADWRSVLTHGTETYAIVRAAGGAGLVRDAVRIGRLGWVNLCGLLARTNARTDAPDNGSGSVADLLDRLADGTPADLHLQLVGGMRPELRDEVGADRLRAAVDGDRAAWRAVRRVLSAPGQRLDISPWLQRAPSREVREVLLRTARAWPAVSNPADDAEALDRARAARDELGPEGLLQLVTAGIRYGPAVLDDVVLVSCRQVDPVLVWVDDDDRTVIVHPPLGADGVADAGTSLRVLGSAVGDETRLQVLRELRVGPRTLSDLCSALDRPRTTLLHHLALLRSAGLVTLTVTSGEPNVYRLDPSGFAAMARSARGFVLG